MSIILFFVLISLLLVQRSNSQIDPTGQPSSQPSGQPSSQPSGEPSGQPSSQPSGQPSGQPSSQPSGQPSSQPSGQPSSQPSGQPSSQPSGQPSSQPSGEPSGQPSSQPSGEPSGQPSSQPSGQPTIQPSGQPSGQPSSQPSGLPSGQPSSQPSGQPTIQPSGEPSGQPTTFPSVVPSSVPTLVPTTYPTQSVESWGQIIWDKRRIRRSGRCDNDCSGHGNCEPNSNCVCYRDRRGNSMYTGPDCSLRICPKSEAWVGNVVSSNNLHPIVECSNRGLCDRESGICICFPGYEGIACQRTNCPEDCNDRGTCWPERILARNAGRIYDTPWDAYKHIGCVCDSGYRGPACELVECPSLTDPQGGYGNEAGRDCSGRGLCDYAKGKCKCFHGFYGSACEDQIAIV